MIMEEFDNLFNERMQRCYETLNAKRAEYAIGDDKLYNFKRAAEVLRCDPEYALWGMFIKHFVSVQDIVEKITWGELPTKKLLAEKITDSINYLILLEAIVTEHINSKDDCYGVSEVKSDTDERQRSNEKKSRELDTMIQGIKNAQFGVTEGKSEIVH